MFQRVGLLLVCVAVAVIAAAGAALGATPAAGTVSTATPTVTWTGGPVPHVEPVRHLCRTGRPGVRHLLAHHHAARVG